MPPGIYRAKTAAVSVVDDDCEPYVVLRFEITEGEGSGQEYLVRIKATKEEEIV